MNGETQVVRPRRHRVFSVGQQFCGRAFRPSKISCSVTRVFGSVRARIGADLHERRRILAAGRQDAARAMILERARHHVLAVREQRRGERVARMAGERAAGEGEFGRSATGRCRPPFGEAVGLAAHRPPLRRPSRRPHDLRRVVAGADRGLAARRRRQVGASPRAAARRPCRRRGCRRWRCCAAC